MHLSKQYPGLNSSSFANREKASNILQRLKAATAEQHETLERRLDLLRPNLSRLEYVELLSRLYRYYRAWEGRSLPILNAAAPSFYCGRVKTPLLKADLQHFSVRPELLPVCEEIPPLHTFSQVLGSTYVLEGSTLGGQLLSRHFIGHLAIEPEGVSFFTGYAERTGSMWKLFCEQLTQFAPLADEAEMVTSAKGTFETLGDWLA